MHKLDGVWDALNDFPSPVV